MFLIQNFIHLPFNSALIIPNSSINLIHTSIYEHLPILYSVKNKPEGALQLFIIISILFMIIQFVLLLLLLCTNNYTNNQQSRFISFNLI